MRSEGDINDETPLDSELVMKWCKRRGLPAGAERILSTPFFKKWINDRCAEVLAKVNDANENNRIKTFEGWYKIEHLLSIVEAIAAVWDDVPVDYFQTHLDELMLTGSFNISRSTHDWLRKNMPVSSLFQAIKRNVLQQQTNNVVPNKYYNSPLAYYPFQTLRDTFNMLARLGDEALSNLEKPSRWRIEEFHDHVQAEAWKHNNPNVVLPQDLFPEPVKVKHADTNWTLFQPIDTHQLAQWGQAVRNCVGAASHYAEQVKKKAEFLVLCMVDGKPVFTVQLTVSNGMMNVKQIVGMSNSSLNQEQRDTYTTVFSTALEIRSQQLQPAAA
jgi:hypothetical protein